MPTPPKGFACPNCVGVRLFVTATKRPKRGLIVRYRKCTSCGFSVVTDERVRPPKKQDASTGTQS